MQLKLLWSAIPKNLQYRVVLVLLISVAASIFEVATLASLIPFIYFLLKPEKVLDQRIIKEIIEYFEINDPSTLLPLITLGFLFFVIISAVTRIYLLRFQTNIAMQTGTTISVKLLKQTLASPYEDFLQLNHSDITSLIYHKTLLLVHKSIIPSLNIFSNLVILILVGGFISYIEPILSMMVSFVIFIFYLVVYVFMKPKMGSYSRIIDVNYTRLMNLLAFALGNYREAKLYDYVTKYTKNYHDIDTELRSSEASLRLLESIPRYGLEAILMIFITSSVVIFKAYGNATEDIISSVVIIAIGAQRLTPLAQNIFTNLTLYKSNFDVVKTVLSNLDHIKAEEIKSKKIDTPSSNLETFKSFEIKDISYKYPNTNDYIIERANLKITSGEFLGITGPSGSGKSTLLDICLMLIKPHSGFALLNAEKLDYDSRDIWSKKISLVSQDIFLSHGTVLENIVDGFTNTPGVHDEQKLNNVLKISCFADEIKELRNGINTLIGERATQLSGGQRQRISIARALFREKPVLILDEATSALDEETQIKILNNIKKMPNAPAVLLVTHRPSTLSLCDKVYIIEGKDLRLLKS